MTLLVVVLVIFVLGLVVTIIRRDGDVIFMWCLFGGAGLALVYLVVGAILVGVLGTHGVYRNFPLVALSDERTSTGGSFFLGSGSIGTSAAFEFYLDNGAGARELYQVPSDGVLVYEDVTGDAQPYAVWDEGKQSNHPAINWCLVGCDHTGLVELHVPPHSIKQGIALGVKQP